MQRALTIHRDARARQFIKFVLVGIMTTALNFVIFAICLKLGLHYLPAAIVAFAIATINSYTWNRIWTFRAGKHRNERLAKFTVVQLVGLSINLVVLSFLVESFSMNELVAQLLANGFVVLSNFTGNKLWTFRA
jgi:putative flippase GtrA